MPELPHRTQETSKNINTNPFSQIYNLNNNDGSAFKIIYNYHNSFMLNTNSRHQNTGHTHNQTDTQNQSQSDKILAITKPATHEHKITQAATTNPVHGYYLNFNFKQFQLSFTQNTYQ